MVVGLSTEGHATELTMFTVTSIPGMIEKIRELNVYAVILIEEVELP